jgi:hypothetical protein
MLAAAVGVVRARLKQHVRRLEDDGNADGTSPSTSPRNSARIEEGYRGV